jgi:uncharacterized protein YktB (UPF0637 family)
VLRIPKKWVHALNFKVESSDINELGQATSSSPRRNLKSRNITQLGLNERYVMMKLQCVYDKKKKKLATRLRASENELGESEKRESLTKSHSFQFNHGTSLREFDDDDDFESSWNSRTSLNPNGGSSSI